MRNHRPLAVAVAIAAFATMLLPGLGWSAPAAEAAEPGSPTDHPITVVLALGDSTPITSSPVELMALAETQIAELRQYWLDMSGGVVDLRLESIQWADTDDDGITDQARCSPRSNRGERIAAVKEDLGYVGSPRSHLFYFIVAGCSFGGVGVQTGSIDSSTWLDVEQGGGNPRQDAPIAHELGHNLSLGHAGAYVCADGSVYGPLVADGGSCVWYEYSDSVSMMGAAVPRAQGSLPVPRAIQLGFLTAADYTDVTGDFSGEVTLQSRDLLTGMRAAQITDPITGEKFWIEYATEDRYSVGNWNARSSVDWDGTTYRRGYGVRVLVEQPSNGTGVLASPAGADGVRALYWNPGQTFTSPSGGISVEVLATSRTTATLSIVTRADVVAPAQPSGLASDGFTVTGTAEPGAVVTITAADGTVLGSATAGADGLFEAPLSPAQLDGAVLAATATDQTGNVSPAASVTVARAPLTAVAERTSVVPDETQTVVGTGFAPGESVQARFGDTGQPFDTQVADSSGAVTFTFAPPSGTPAGPAQVVLIGAASVQVAVSFEVRAPAAPGNGSGSGGSGGPGGSGTTRLPATGGDATPWAVVAFAIVGMLGGAALLRRRRV